MNKVRRTTSEFIEQARLKHGNKFDYSKTIYINNKSKVLIGCEIHGFFEQRASSHLFGYGCQECLRENRNPYRGKEIYYENRFKNLGNRIHKGKYDYSLSKYKRNDEKMIIICPNHGIFFQTAYDHTIREHGCPKCVGKFKTNEEFINACIEIHNNKYNYDLCDYQNSNSIIKIICPNHGEFSQKASYHINGSGCLYCKESYGENIIRTILEKNKLKYTPQKRFEDCSHIYKLAFDFYLPEEKICIEYNGIQHYEPIEFFGGQEGFNLRVHRDRIKEEYCKRNNIKLIIVKYNENVLESLSKHIKLIDA